MRRIMLICNIKLRKAAVLNFICPMESDRPVEVTMAKAVVSYSEEAREVRILVPRGTKSTELGKIVEHARAALFGNPRICSTCVSGRHYLVMEEAAEVTEINLER